MIAPWSNLNQKGKWMVVGCVLNMLMAVYLVSVGSMLAVFSTIVAAWCGCWTYNKHYQHQDARDINDGREE